MQEKAMSFLVVDDLPSMRLHAKRLFEEMAQEDKFPCHLDEAENGRQAVELASKQVYDLIIMDIAMPEQNGIKTAQALWHERANSKILFWSQYDHEAYIRQLGKIVPDEAIHGYVLKNQDTNILKAAIKQILFEDLPYINPAIEKIKRRLETKGLAISDSEFNTLLDIALGLTDKAIALKEHVSYRGAQNRLSTLLQKLTKNEDNHMKESAGIEIINPRTRLICEAIRRGLITVDALEEKENELRKWMFSEYGYYLE
jgi:DNA-binding NarL/FixJ family response regulator